MRTLFLHIGTEKTGTTSLQLLLHGNSERLSSLGIWYPADQAECFTEGAGHFPLAATLVGGDAVEFVSSSKLTNLSNCLESFITAQKARSERITVLSAEHFSSRVWNECNIREFFVRLKSVYESIKVVVYIRDQAQLAVSSYFTAVMCGYREPFEPALITPENLYFNTRHILDLWSNVFSRKNMIVKEFRTEKLIGKDICTDFCNIIGLDPAQLEEMPRVNKSLPHSSIEALRLINAWLPTFEEDSNGWRMAQDLREHFIVPFFPTHHDRKMSLTSEERNSILARFITDNEYVNEHYCRGQLSESWFPSKLQDPDQESDPSAASVALHLPLSLISVAENLRSAQQRLEITQQQLEITQQQLEITQQQLEITQQQLEST